MQNTESIRRVETAALLPTDRHQLHRQLISIRNPLHVSRLIIGSTEIDERIVPSQSDVLIPTWHLLQPRIRLKSNLKDVKLDGYSETLFKLNHKL